MFGIFYSWILCYWNLKILHSNRKCAKWVEISGCKMDRTCSVWYVLVVSVKKTKKNACFGVSWPLCAIFKIRSQISENVIFKKIVKIPFVQKCQRFSAFSVVHLAVHTHTVNLLKTLLTKTHSGKKCFFAPKTKDFQITALNFRQTKVHGHSNKLIKCSSIISLFHQRH